MTNKAPLPPNKTRRPAATAQPTMTERVMALPRLGRTLIVFLGVLIMAFAISNVVGEFYARAFATTVFDQAIFWIVAVFCLGMYAAGYVYIIGIPGVTPAVGRAQTIYLTVVAVLTAVSLVWLIVRGAGAMIE